MSNQIVQCPDCDHHEKYNNAIVEFEKIIQSDQIKFRSAIVQIIECRSIHHFTLIREWVTFRKNDIPELSVLEDDSDGICQRLGEAVTAYWHQIYFYRKFFQLNERALYRKIISFEFYYFCKFKVFSRIKLKFPVMKNLYIKEGSLLKKEPAAVYMVYRLFHEALPYLDEQAERRNLAIKDRNAVEDRYIDALFEGFSDLLEYCDSSERGTTSQYSLFLYIEKLEQRNPGEEREKPFFLRTIHAIEHLIASGKYDTFYC